MILIRASVVDLAGESPMPDHDGMGPAADYWVDRWQRTWLFLDILRRRGNIYQEQKAKLAPLGELVDIACAYLASDFARRITGGTIYVDGGANVVS